MDLHKPRTVRLNRERAIFTLALRHVEDILLLPSLPPPTNVGDSHAVFEGQTMNMVEFEPEGFECSKSAMRSQLASGAEFKW